jgi:hypothetical protein
VLVRHVAPTPGSESLRLCASRASSITLGAEEPAGGNGRRGRVGRRTPRGLTGHARHGILLVTMTRYLVLLRGINVGGRNKVSMAALRELLESHGHTKVSTYIASRTRTTAT